MSNIDTVVFSTRIERAAASLDARVRDFLEPLSVSGPPQTWSDQLDEIASDIYRSTVRRTKEAIRAVAQEFRGTDRMRYLLDGARDTVGRIEGIRGILETMDVLALPEARATEAESDRLHRLRTHIPILRDAFSSTVSRFSRWQDEFGIYQDVFCVLEFPVETLESLLMSLSAGIPDAHIVKGRTFMQRLIALWNERRAIVERATNFVGSEDEARDLEERLDDQRDIEDSVVELLSVLLGQLDDAPSAPVYFHGQEILVHQFLRANEAFSRLRSQQLDIGQDLGRLERVLDRLMDVVA